MGERLQLANGDAYTKGAGEDVWSRSSAGSDATTSFRNDLVASTDALEYLRSVADKVTEVGAETSRAAATLYAVQHGLLHADTVDAERKGL